MNPAASSFDSADSEMPGVAILEGAISIESALRARSRQVYRLYIRPRRSSPGLSRLIRTATELEIPIEEVTDERIDELSRGRSHGGVLAAVGPRRFVALGQLLPTAEPGFLAMIDGVEDPYNFGSALRSLYAAGLHGLIVRARNWTSAAGVVARASAGASELLPTAMAGGTEEAAEFFNARGMTIVTCRQDAEISLYDADLAGPILMIIGGERRGLTRSFSRKGWLSLSIPYARTDAHSLGAAATAAIVGFEVMRQRLRARNRSRV